MLPITCETLIMIHCNYCCKSCTYFFVRVTGTKYNCSVSVFSLQGRLLSNAAVLHWTHHAVLTKPVSCFRGVFEKASEEKMFPFSWKESPGYNVHPGILVHSHRSRVFKKVDIWPLQREPECGVSAADSCVKCRWKLVNDGFEVEVPTANLLPREAVSDADEQSVSCSRFPQMTGHCSLHIDCHCIWTRTKTTPADYFPHCGVTSVTGGETNRTGDAFLNVHRWERVDVFLSQHVISSQSCAFFIYPAAPTHYKLQTRLII